MSATAYDAEHPWERQPWDSELGWSLFGDYLMLPAPRKLRDIAKRSGYPETFLRDLARQAYWPERAAFWDEHLSDLRTKTIERIVEETAEEAARRQLTLTRTMQRLAGMEFEKLFSLASREGEAPGILTPREAIRLADRGIILERLVMGEATDRPEAGPNLDGLSLEDLREARRLQDKAGVR